MVKKRKTTDAGFKKETFIIYGDFECILIPPNTKKYEDIVSVMTTS